MAEHVEVHFVGEIVVADRAEEVGPGLVGQFQVVDGMGGEKAAVVARDAVGLVADVDEAEEVLKILPTGIGDGVEPGHGVGLGDRLFGQQMAVLAEGDEHDAVDEPLRHFDRVVQRAVLAVVQFGDQVGAVAGIVLVKLVADRPLPLGGHFQERDGPRAAMHPIVDEALAMKEDVELLEEFVVAERLQAEVLVDPFRRGAS